MIEFILGGLAVACLYTFAPSLAVVPSGWIRKGLAWLRDALNRPRD